MEALEKIYINPLPNPSDGYVGIAWDEPHKTMVEYIRKDAFIEKAEKFFTDKFEVENYNDNIDVDGSPIFNYGRFIEDFKKYMEGE